MSRTKARLHAPSSHWTRSMVQGSRYHAAPAQFESSSEGTSNQPVLECPMAESGHSALNISNAHSVTIRGLKGGRERFRFFEKAKLPRVAGSEPSAAVQITQSELPVSTLSGHRRPISRMSARDSLRIFVVEEWSITF